MIVTFSKFSDSDLAYAEAIVDLLLSAYDGTVLQSLAVTGSNRDTSPHLAHAFQSFLLGLEGGWSLAVYRNGGRNYWTVQQACVACARTGTPILPTLSRWEPMGVKGSEEEVLSCGRCGLALASPSTGVHFTFSSEEIRGFDSSCIEVQVEEQSSVSILEAVGETAELRTLILRLIAVSSNTVYWSHSDRLAQLLKDA